MNKKLIAVAVASALGTPAVAMAQGASTVQIYGNITYEYGIGDQGRNRPNVDYADSPGGSAIGFKGEEALGGGLSAWFQCESSADVRGLDQSGWCTRNSAVGFKGGFGNIFFGRWDTPMKRALNVGTVGAEETGILGMSFLPFGGSGGASAAPFGNQNTDLGYETQQRQRFKRRENALSYYETPVFGGFQVMGAFSAGHFAADAPSVDGAVNDKPRIWSLAAIYTAGPLGIGLAYEKHVDFGAFSTPPLAAAARDLDDRGWGITAAYTFAGKVKVGATFLDRKFETAPGRDLKKKTYTVGVDWAIAGPHGLEAQFAYADDSKGNSLVGIGGNGGATAPCTVLGCIGDTGAKAYSLAYRYNFSKRTRVKVAYVRVDNDGNTAAHRIGNTAALAAGGAANANGQTVDAWGFHISHSF